MGDETYNTKIYITQGGDTIGIRSDGSLNLADDNITGINLRKAIIDRNAAITVKASINIHGYCGLSVASLPSNVQYLGLEMTSNLIEGVLDLTSCTAGREIHVALIPGSTQSGEIVVRSPFDSSICKLRGSRGNFIEQLRMFNSNNSTARAHLVAFIDNVWSVINDYQCEEFIGI